MQPNEKIQQTLRHVVFLEGPGLHSGKMCKLLPQHSILRPDLSALGRACETELKASLP